MPTFGICRLSAEVVRSSVALDFPNIMLVILHASYEGVSMFASYIVGAARTPRGRGKRNKGALAGIHPQELFAKTLTKLKDLVGFDPRVVVVINTACVSYIGDMVAEVSIYALIN